MDKKYIIAGLLVVFLILLGIIFVSMGNVQAEYENFTCNDTGTSFEVPHGLKVRTDNTIGNVRDTVMSTPDGDIVIQRTVTDDSMMQDISAQGYEMAAQMDNSYDGQQINGVTVHTCSRTVKNDTLGETIIVTSNNGDNETVEHIINSIKWGNHSFIGDNSNNDDSSSGDDSVNSTSENTAYAYKSDGSPMYSQDEVDDYMKEKYGLVNYHVGDNGYIDMDEPGYDDAGHKVDEEGKRVK